MKRPFRLVPLIRRLARDRRGSVAMMFGLSLAGLFLATGASVDFGRALQLKSLLQGTVDSAALAGASAYVGSGTSGSGSSVASSYMNAAIPLLPRNSGITYTVTTGTVTSSGQVTGNSVTITATAQEPTTILSAFVHSLGVSVSSTAINPIVNVTFDMGNQFYSSAWDLNAIYYYTVPSNGGLPSTSDLTQLWSNVNVPCSAATGSMGTTAPAPIQLAASQKIGFALYNVTGGKCAYGSNQYGGTQGSSRYFYSQLFPPSTDAYPTVTQDCSLLILPTTGDGVVTTPAYPPGGTCYSSATSPYPYTLASAAPTCAQLQGKSWLFAWNDMGGVTDDMDYNDMEYTVSCSLPAGSNATQMSVYLSH